MLLPPQSQLKGFPPVGSFYGLRAESHGRSDGAEELPGNIRPLSEATHQGIRLRRGRPRHRDRDRRLKFPRAAARKGLPPHQERRRRRHYSQVARK